MLIEDSVAQIERFSEENETGVHGISSSKSRKVDIRFVTNTRVEPFVSFEISGNGVYSVGSDAGVHD